MGNIKIRMVKIYNTIDYDWMNYKILDDLTYHHIIKKEDGGQTTIDNGALLTRRAHSYLNLMEEYDYEMFEEVNNLLKQINEQRHEPNYKQKRKMELLLLKFELRNASKLINVKKKSQSKKLTMVTNIRKKEQKGK